MKKYFELYVRYYYDDGTDYKILVSANDSVDAIRTAVDKNLFKCEDDITDVNYVEEFTREELTEEDCQTLIQNGFTLN